MEASSGRFRARPIVVDFLGALFVAFCIGISTALVLGACVVLMASDARGAEQPRAPAKEQRTAEFVLTHTLVTKYTGLVPLDRTRTADPRSASARSGHSPKRKG
jgi:hypothetical protein